MIPDMHVVIFKADKGNTSVSMDHPDYNSKMLDCLESINVKVDPYFNLRGRTARSAIPSTEVNTY